VVENLKQKECKAYGPSKRGNFKEVKFQKFKISKMLVV
jgi:hypothetical protein